MPQKNELTDRKNILSSSKEFNPVVSFPVVEPKKKKKPETQHKATSSIQLRTVKSFLTYGSNASSTFKDRSSKK